MKACTLLAAWVLVAVSLPSMGAQTADELRAMFVASDFFALRDAVEKMPNPPLFYRGAVEAMRDEAAPAERDLGAVIKAAPHSEEAYQAHDLLSNLYIRHGLYHEALGQLEAAHAERPDAADVKNAIPLFRALSAAPDMKVVRRRPSKFVRLGEDHASLPIRINGQPVTYGFDTGASLSFMGEADAKALGLTVTRVESKLSESSGSDVAGFSIAMVKDFELAGLHLRNVAFLVLQDTGEPFVTVPIRSRGLIGLPVLLAMQRVHWETVGGAFTFGAETQAKAAGPQNVLFDGTRPIVQLSAEGKSVVFSLDTGATDTDLNASFAKKFPELVAAGDKESRAITGLGGSNHYDSVILRPIAFHVGGFDATVKAPHVFPTHSLGKYDGNLGHDILDTAKAVTLDFEAMQLVLE